MVRLASGQSPTEPNRHRLGRIASRRHQASPVRRTAVATGFVEVDGHYSSPLARPEPASLFKELLSRHLQDKVQKRCRVAGPAFAVPFQGCLPGHPAPSHIPSGAILVHFPLYLLHAPFFIFRKIHLYVKSKRVTHDSYKHIELTCPLPQLVHGSPPQCRKSLF